MDLHLVGLHQRVREQLLAHLLDLGARVVNGRCVDLDVDDLADAGARYREAQVLERRVHRLALRVEDPLLRSDEDGRPHPSTTRGSSTYAGNGIFVRSSNASTYFDLVCITTSSGSSGPGEALSHPVASQ